MGKPEYPVPSPDSGIPVISDDTLEALTSQFTGHNGDGQSWGDRLTEMQSKLLETNPNLVKFIEIQVGKYPGQLHQPMFEVIVGSMVLVERQSEADAMNQSFPDL